MRISSPSQGEDLRAHSDDEEAARTLEFSIVFNGKGFANIRNLPHVILSSLQGILSRGSAKAGGKQKAPSSHDDTGESKTEVQMVQS